MSKAGEGGDGKVTDSGMGGEQAVDAGVADADRGRSSIGGEDVMYSPQAEHVVQQAPADAALENVVAPAVVPTVPALSVVEQVKPTEVPGPPGTPPTHVICSTPPVGSPTASVSPSPTPTMPAGQGQAASVVGGGKTS